jgi:hypothetical protein
MPGQRPCPTTLLTVSRQQAVQCLQHTACTLSSVALPQVASATALQPKPPRPPLVRLAWALHKTLPPHTQPA